jgi:membrane-bound lytic murein transglycosylase D
MKSTRVRAVLAGLLLGSTLAVLCVQQAAAAEIAMPRPAALDRDVQFWIRVYSEISTNAGFLHDENNLGVVYETVHFGPNSTPHEREALVDGARDRYVAALKRIATSTDPLSADDQRIRDLWGDEGTPARLLDATNHVRFQLGQSDRFRAGLSRAGQWETHIAETLANLGLPSELAVLPHVESSFNPAAYSKVGAAGLWQFMRSTGRRYLRIDSTVDDRLDPFRSTEAAAQLLAYNYRLLGSWPLALTAYNHGAEGMRRAKESLGTDDIVEIVRNYKSPTFGFASRNFYVSFLAALEIDHNPEKYFGQIEHSAEAKFQELQLPTRASITALQRALGIDLEKLRALNPALLPACWRGARPVPSGYRLRLPLEGTSWTSDLLARRLAPGGELVAVTQEANRHRVQRGETLASIAGQYGVSPRTLAALNGLSVKSRLRPGHYVRVPETQPSLVQVTARNLGKPADALAPAATPAAPSVPKPLPMTAPAPTQAPSLADAATAEKPDVYVVQRGESISDIAKSAGISEQKLLALNGIRDPNYVFEGQQLTLTPQSLGEEPAASAEGPETAATSESVPASPPPPAVGGVPADVAERESAEDAAAVASIAKPAAHAEPVSAAQAEALSPAVGAPIVEGSETADPIDYSVAKDGSIVVAATETLGHYADWLSVGAAHLRTINHMRYGRPVLMGHKLKLDFGRVSREDFEQKRREYHRTLQASYFAAHRISGTEVYIARHGDSLWTVTQRYEHLPVWLLQQYNPDVDFSEMRAGTQIVVPRIEDVASVGG